MVLCQLPIWENRGEGTAKREGAFPHQLTRSENLGQQFSAPGVASFSKPSSCTGGQKKNGSIPLGDRQHELQLKFRGTQMLGVYTISYKYIKCNVLKKKGGVDISLDKEMTCPICHFYNRQTFLGAAVRTHVQSVLAGK